MSEDSRPKMEDRQAYDEALLGSIADGVFAVDKEGKLTVANPAGERLVGWTFAEMRGKDWYPAFNLVDKDGVSVPREDRPFGKVFNLQSHEAFSTEDFFYQRKDGTRFPVSLHSSPIIRNGEIIGAVGIMRDITHEREVDQAKSEFVSLASHQLRTPLTSIGWYVELLQTAQGTLTDDQRQYLNEVATAQKRMVELINALLNVSRIELGTFVANPQPVDMQAVIDGILKDTKGEVQEKALNMIQDIAPNTVAVEVDPVLMRIILQNVVTNAIRYSVPNGTIRITISRQDSDLAISVADTGIGIPASEQEKIFTKLFRADNARVTNSYGNGLGLYLVKSILERLGGKIRFQSSESKGTTFYITLPLGNHATPA